MKKKANQLVVGDIINLKSRDWKVLETTVEDDKFVLRCQICGSKDLEVNFVVGINQNIKIA